MDIIRDVSSFLCFFNVLKSPLFPFEAFHVVRARTIEKERERERKRERGKNCRVV